MDLEVVRLTKGRKPYLEALLAFTTGRARTAAIPAPPFLVERQVLRGDDHRDVCTDLLSQGGVAVGDLLT